ncbi:MAG: hypothetical protein EZS28_016900 [Streblomastix strix]|uniref:Uncharacterized protein n=1 Tax=Streblomastix strix TaxID=222440 RepID=A0A5J4VZA2_9EUKA|nr:MAG: hypothetical protein EZS28_016900 [Streblomastix strix]
MQHLSISNQHFTTSNNALWDQTQHNLLRRDDRINPQIDKNTFGNQNSELLRRHTSNPLGQTNTQNTINENNENIGIVRMGNVNREMRNRTKIYYNILEMDMESERDEYKNVRKKKAENEIIIE